MVLVLLKADGTTVVDRTTRVVSWAIVILFAIALLSWQSSGGLLLDPDTWMRLAFLESCLDRLCFPA